MQGFFYIFTIATLNYSSLSFCSEVAGINFIMNFKALGIEKEMKDEFQYFNDSNLSKIVNSTYFECPLIKRREKEADYCMIEVTSCKYDNWWYNDLIGFEFFCRIIYRNIRGSKVIYEFLGVKINNNKEIVFKSFDPTDVCII